MKLVVVESPSKTKKIKSFLGQGYIVTASLGHIVDLPQKEVGIDLDNNFKPNYQPIKGKTKTIGELRNLYNKSTELILATDPDREGEAIAWHIAREVGAISKDSAAIKYGSKSVKRVTFNEITENAVNQAMARPTTIDLNLVNAQQARRFLDRIVGYKLSPFLWKKVQGGLSAGRVQSVAVRIIVDREEEIRNFSPNEYWNILLDPTKEQVETTVKVLDTSQKDDSNFVFSLDIEKGKQISTRNEVVEILDKLKNQKYEVVEIKKEQSKKKPPAPFTTSTLQQEAIKKLKMDSKKVMKIAQELYESGLITYMRTDSTNLSDEAVTEIRKFITNNYAPNYLPANSQQYKSSNKVAQEAHEAIRPTHITNIPDKTELAHEQKELYTLIWKRTLACQFEYAIFNKQSIVLQYESFRFKANASTLEFDGFLKILGYEGETPIILPNFNKGDILFAQNLLGKQAFTKPPSRFNEATLIKKLEKEEIGRPSTYSSIISTIKTRSYVSTDDKGFFIPEPVAFNVITLLKEHFSNIIDIKFTAKLEQELDDIANRKADYIDVLDSFWKPFFANLKEKESLIDSDQYAQNTKLNIKCPICGSEMVERVGKYGKFASCSKYPDCKGIAKITTEDKPVSLPLRFLSTAPLDSENNEMVLRKGSYGAFWASANKELKETKPVLLKTKCPECDNHLVERKSANGKFIGCSSYPNCKYIDYGKQKTRQRN